MYSLFKFKQRILLGITVFIIAILFISTIFEQKRTKIPSQILKLPNNQIQHPYSFTPQGIYNTNNADDKIEQNRDQPDEANASGL